MTVLYYIIIAILFAFSVKATKFLSGLKVIDERLVLFITSIIFTIVIYYYNNFSENNKYIKDRDSSVSNK